jgi:precorrin-6x reductase
VHGPRGLHHGGEPVMIDVDPSRPAVIEIAGQEVELTRSMRNLARVEQVVGAAHPFALRLDQRAVPQAEIVRVYAAILRDVHGAPSTRAIEEWVFHHGSRHSDLALYIYSLTLGAEELEAVARARRLAAEKTREGEPEKRPFVTTAPPTFRT